MASRSMTDHQLQQFRGLLSLLSLELEMALTMSAQSSAPVSPDNAIGRLTRQDAMQAQQLALELRRRNELRLQQVKQALRRLDQGSYGLCARCEEEISEARLRVKPEAQFCLSCADRGSR